MLPKVEFDGAPFGDVVQFHRDVGRVHIRVEWDVLRQIGVDDRTLVNVALENVTFEQALGAVLRSADKQERIAMCIGKDRITITLGEQETRQTGKGAYP